MLHPLRRPELYLNYSQLLVGQAGDRVLQRVQEAESEQASDHPNKLAVSVSGCKFVQKRFVEQLKQRHNRRGVHTQSKTHTLQRDA